MSFAYSVLSVESVDIKMQLHLITGSVKISHASIRGSSRKTRIYILYLYDSFFLSLFTGMNEAIRTASVILRFIINDVVPSSCNKINILSKMSLT